MRADDVPIVRPQITRVSTRLTEGSDIAFRRFPPTAGLSQTRVSQITQDDDGFLWFGTQSGLNRFDGYKCKVFKHDPKQPDSLGGVFLIFTVQRQLRKALGRQRSLSRSIRSHNRDVSPH